MNHKYPGTPAGRSGTVRWRNGVRRAVLRTGCLLCMAGFYTVLSIVLSAPLTPGDTGGLLVPTAQAADNGQGNNNGGGNGNGRGNDNGQGNDNGRGNDNGQGQDGDQDVDSDWQNDPAWRGDDGQGDNDDQGDEGQGNNKDEGGDGAAGAGISTEGKGQDGGARAKDGSRGGGRGGARGARGGHGVAESRPDLGDLGGIVDDDFEDRMAAGKAAPIREAMHATVLSADEEAAAIAAGWMSID